MWTVARRLGAVCKEDLQAADCNAVGSRPASDSIQSNLLSMTPAYEDKRTGIAVSDETSVQTVPSAGGDIGRFSRLGAQNPSPDRVCAELAKLFQVKADEIGLLKLENGLLKFLFPPGLKTAGLIPLNGTAVAARTASTKSSLLSNTFSKVKHVRIFEDVKPGIASGENPERMPIQKLMSVPVLHVSGAVLGVVQVSRKGFEASSAGPDFTGDDLKLLEQSAKVIAALDFMRQPSD